VLDYKAPSSIRAIEAYRTGKTATLLLKFATWLTHTEVDGEDLVAGALICVCDPDRGRPWDPARGSFTAHMRIVIRDLARRGWRSARARREVVEPTFAFDDRMQHPGPPPDEAVSDARTLERLRRLGDIVRQRVSHKPLTLQVFDLGYQDIDDADEMARLLGCKVNEVYDANRQIARHAARVLAEEEKKEALRMKDLREKAKKKTVKA
jgi:DNA-directed RNA polymerase specialized sigma24 family protein